MAMSDKTYKIKDVNGNMVEIAAETARTLYFALEREYHKEDVLEELSEWLADEDKETFIDVDQVSDDLIERIVHVYEKGLENDDSWRYSLEYAIEEHIDAVRDELDAKGKNKDEREDR